MRSRWKLGAALLVLVPVLAIGAQRGFGRRGRSPGMNPNANLTYDGKFTFVRVKFEPR